MGQGPSSEGGQIFGESTSGECHGSPQVLTDRGPADLREVRSPARARLPPRASTRVKSFTPSRPNLQV
jgi:hypothetical protein